MAKQKVDNGLTGWHFIVLDPENPPRVLAQGVVQRSLGADTHLVQFAGTPHWRAMTGEQLAEGLLFPNPKLLDDFMQGYLAQFQPAPADAAPAAAEVEAEEVAAEVASD